MYLQPQIQRPALEGQRRKRNTSVVHATVRSRLRVILRAMHEFILARGITNVRSLAVKRDVQGRTTYSNSMHSHRITLLVYSDVLSSYRIHLSPGSRRSSSSATRAAIQRAIANPSANGSVGDRKSTRLNSSHSGESRMPSSA